MYGLQKSRRPRPWARRKFTHSHWVFAGYEVHGKDMPFSHSGIGGQKMNLFPYLLEFIGSVGFHDSIFIRKNVSYETVSVPLRRVNGADLWSSQWKRWPFGEGKSGKASYVWPDPVEYQLFPPWDRAQMFAPMIQHPYPSGIRVSAECVNSFSVVSIFCIWHVLFAPAPAVPSPSPSPPQPLPYSSPFP